MERTHHVVDSATNTLSIAFNIVLLYLIKYHSPFKIPTYQTLLYIDACLDLAVAVLALNVQSVSAYSFGKVAMQDARRALSNGPDRTEESALLSRPDKESALFFRTENQAIP